MAKKTNKDAVDQFYDSGLYMPKRTIYFGGESDDCEINAHSVARLKKGLYVLESESNEPITILINSGGGDVTAGIAAYDFIKNCKSHITMIAYGEIASMAAIIFQAADVRVMSVNSTLMIHYGTLGAEGHPKTVEKIVYENKRIDGWMEKMLLSKIRKVQPKYSLSKLKYKLDHDTYLTAQKALELGLCDKIIGSEEED